MLLWGNCYAGGRSVLQGMRDAGAQPTYLRELCGILLWNANAECEAP